MSSLSSIEDATKNFFTAGGATIDLAKVIEIVNAIISAAPAIESGIASATPYVEAIAVMIKNGGQPTDDEWTALKASLDAGSAALAEAETEAQAELDPAQPADGGANIVTEHTGINTGSGETE